MAQRIQRFGVGQTAKVFGVLYALMGLIAIPFFLLGASFAPEGSRFGMGIIIGFPIAYGLMGFVFTGIACLVYNMVAGWIGGVEIELDDTTLEPM